MIWRSRQEIRRSRLHDQVCTVWDFNNRGSPSPRFVPLGHRAQRSAYFAVFVKARPPLLPLQERTYTFVAYALHALQRVYREWKERARSFLHRVVGSLRPLAPLPARRGGRSDRPTLAAISGACLRKPRDEGARSPGALILVSVRLVIARCQVDYAGRLTAHLPMAPRLILIKSDGSVSIHADDRAYKPLNWMSPPCSLVELEVPDHHPVSGDGPLSALWEVRGRDGDTLQIWMAEVYHDSSHELGVDPGLQKAGVEAQLQALLAEHPEALAPGLSLVRREHPTPIGPVDLLCRDPAGAYVAVEIKRRGEIDGVEQLSRYLDLMRRDTLLGTVYGILAAQQFKPQARVLANDRGISCVTVDYDMLRGLESADDRLF
jgi:endonuclease